MVTGAETAVGRHAVRLLTGSGGEVRVFLEPGLPAERGQAAGHAEQAAEQLRAAGCKVALGALEDEGHVETALEQVHTVLHLLGRPGDDPGGYLDRTATVVGAAIGAGCRRLVLLSDLAAGDPGGNAWLQALAEAEEMAAEAPMESVVLRAAVVHDREDPLTAQLAAGAGGIGAGGAHWPIAAVDVATTAVLADAARDLDSALHVVVALAGPHRLATSDYLDVLRRVLPDRAEGDPVAADLPAAVVELLSREIDPPDDAVGGAGRSVEDGLTRRG